MHTDYETLSVSQESGITTVSIDHPPMNLLDPTMMRELGRLGKQLAVDEATRVVVVESADEDYFIAHADVQQIRQLPKKTPPSFTLNPLHVIMERWRTLPQPTIAKIEGRARGGGSEFVLSLDMRFGAIGRCILSQPEVALGIMPGAGGTQRLPGILTRGRALEVILGCQDFDALTAERYGYLNRALPPAEIGAFVDGLASRIASYPTPSVQCAKRSVDSALSETTIGGLLAEADYWQEAFQAGESESRFDRLIEAGGQQREGEMDWGPLLDNLAERG